MHKTNINILITFTNHYCASPLCLFSFRDSVWPATSIQCFLHGCNQTTRRLPLAVGGDHEQLWAQWPSFKLYHLAMSSINLSQMGWRTTSRALLQWQWWEHSYCGPERSSSFCFCFIDSLALSRTRWPCILSQGGLAICSYSVAIEAYPAVEFGAMMVLF